MRNTRAPTPLFREPGWAAPDEIQYSFQGPLSIPSSPRYTERHLSRPPSRSPYVPATPLPVDPDYAMTIMSPPVTRLPLVRPATTIIQPQYDTRSISSSQKLGATLLGTPPEVPTGGKRTLDHWTEPAYMPITKRAMSVGPALMYESHLSADGHWTGRSSREEDYRQLAADSLGLNLAQRSPYHTTAPSGREGGHGPGQADMETQMEVPSMAAAGTMTDKSPEHQDATTGTNAPPARLEACIETNPLPHRVEASVNTSPVPQLPTWEDMEKQREGFLEEMRTLKADRDSWQQKAKGLEADVKNTKGLVEMAEKRMLGMKLHIRAAVEKLDVDMRFKAK